jgi:hypothetical protein
MGDKDNLVFALRRATKTASWVTHDFRLADPDTQTASCSPGRFEPDPARAFVPYLLRSGIANYLSHDFLGAADNIPGDFFPFTH